MSAVLLVCISIFLVVLVPCGAVGLKCEGVSAVKNLIAVVLSSRSVPQVVRRVVQLVAVSVEDFMPGRTFAVKSFSNYLMDVQSVAASKAYVGVPVDRVHGRFQETRYRTLVAEYAT